MDNNKLCPSYVAKPGSELFGVVSSSGFIDYLQATLEVTETFIEEVQKGREPEKRFRFAGNCAKSGCNHWTADQKQCGLIDKVIEIYNKPVSEKLEHCPIRTKCRWYYQRGNKACAQCNQVIRNMETKALELEEQQPE